MLLNRATRALDLLTLLTILLLSATFFASAQEAAKPIPPAQILAYPREKGDRVIADISLDGATFLQIRQERKKVDGEGTIDSLMVCDVNTGKPIKTITGPGGEQADQMDVAAFSPDAKMAVAGSWYGHLRLFDVQSGRELALWRESFRSVERVAYSYDGKYVASATYDDATRRTLIHVYDTASKLKIATFAGHEESISSLHFMSDGRLISGSMDELVCVWDLTKPPTEVAPKPDVSAEPSRLPLIPPAIKLIGHSGAVRAVAASLDGHRAASCGADGRICQWNLETGKIIRKFTPPAATEGAARPMIEGLVFLANGTQFLSRGLDMTLRLWDFETGQELYRLNRAANPLLILPDGKRMIHGAALWSAPQNFTATPDGPTPTNEITAWVPSTVLGPVKDALYGISTARVIGDRLIVATSEGYRNRFTTFDMLSGKQVGETEVKRQPDGTREPMSFSPDGRWIACGGDNGSLVIVDAATGQDVKSLPAVPRHVYKALWSPDGNTLFTSENMRQDDHDEADICVWDVATGTLTKRLQGSIGLIWAMTLTSDGKYLLSGSGNFVKNKNTDTEAAIHIWDISAGKEISSLRGQDFIIHCIAVSADGKRAASGARQGPVILWDLTTGKEIRRVEGSENRNGNLSIEALAFSPDGKRLASGGADSDIRVWDVATGAEMVRLEDHRKWITWLQWTSDSTLISTSTDGTARVWAVKEAEAAKNEGL